jgi:hypothetical protein
MGADPDFALMKQCLSPASVSRNETAGCPYDKKNPYVAFRRRTEKMQTRKNRKSDEGGYLVSVWVLRSRFGRIRDYCSESRSEMGIFFRLMKH